MTSFHILYSLPPIGPRPIQFTILQFWLASLCNSVTPALNSLIVILITRLIRVLEVCIVFGFPTCSISSHISLRLPTVDKDFHSPSVEHPLELMYQMDFLAHVSFSPQFSSQFASKFSSSQLYLGSQSGNFFSRFFFTTIILFEDRVICLPVVYQNCDV